LLNLSILVGDKSKLMSEHHLLPIQFWKSLSFLRVWITEKPLRNFLKEIVFWASEIAPGGLTATMASQTGNPYSRVVWLPKVAGQTANSSNGQNFDLKVAITSLTVWPWVVLQFDREVRRIFPRDSFWSMGYKYSSISFKIALFAI
jgi:hypothetical protein